MKLTRRQFVLLAAAVAAGCGREKNGGATTAPANQPSKPAGAVDAGAVGEFKADDVYDNFREQGFFVVRRDKQMFALSSICTHKGCKVRVRDDLSFFCKCHGSTFDKEGHVTKGPAKRDLPRLAVATDDREHVLVDPAQEFVVKK
ncbi:MAG TPA: Rieske 2Fe-2S domain-containing protein [Tepidisphaeraceae bacterium]|jgi:Rieske Fe-S protein